MKQRGKANFTRLTINNRQYLFLLRELHVLAFHVQTALLNVMYRIQNMMNHDLSWLFSEVCVYVLMIIFSPSYMEAEGVLRLIVKKAMVK